MAASFKNLSNTSLRLVALGVTLAIAVPTYVLRDYISPRVTGGLGAVCFIALTFVFSSNIRRIEWRTVWWGIAMQLALAVLILKLSINGWRPGYELFNVAADAANKFTDFTQAGAEFVFGPLANRAVMDKAFANSGFVFAFMGLPSIIFISSFFSVLYHLGILQFLVKIMSRVMMKLMRTSGAETLSNVANVFMGQTEAPLIVKPYVPTMTQSELLAIMVGGLATISGGMMVVYIAIGADPVAIVTTSVMAAPASLYLSKILIPETEVPVTSGQMGEMVKSEHANLVDAAAAGASDGLALALNVAAMLIAFLSLLAGVDYVLGMVHTGLSLSAIFAKVFAPAALLLGVPSAEVPAMADLLGVKLVANEFVAYVKLTTEYKDVISPRTLSLATYALTGFANFGSIGILLGGLGAMAPTRRGDLARLGGAALLAGFLATMVNASIAAMFL
jgi:concentrative nucleoside transporter, CNT family